MQKMWVLLKEGELCKDTLNDGLGIQPITWDGLHNYKNTCVCAIRFAWWFNTYTVFVFALTFFFWLGREGTRRDIHYCVTEHILIQFGEYDLRPPQLACSAS